MKLQSFVTLLPVVLPLTQAAPAIRQTNPGLRGDKSLLGYSPSNRVGGDSPDIKYTLLPEQKEDPDIGSYLDFQKADNPQPIRGPKGADDPGPSMFCVSRSYYEDSMLTPRPGNYYYDRINSDKLAPPGTDNGQTINAQWPMDKFTILCGQTQGLLTGF